MADSLDLAVIGAGPIGILSAALAARAGHRVGLWCPRSPAPRGATRLTLRCTGALDSSFEVAAIAGPAELARWDTVLVAIPATAYAGVLGAALPHLRDGQAVILSGALSLVQLWLQEAAQRDGRAPQIAAWGTTLGTAARSGPLAAQIATLRPRLGVAALPAAARDQLVARCAALFGDRFEPMAAQLGALLSNINPIAHAGQVIPNLSRIEKGEPWRLFANFTPAGARIAEALDVERLAIARRFGLELRPLAAHYRLSYQVEGADLAAIAQAIEVAGRGAPGPVETGHRYIEEDVPFGLVPLQRLGAVAGVPTPMLDAVVRLLGTALGRPFGELNPILAALELDRETPESLVRRLG